MNIEELKEIIEHHTGVPASLLTGETAEENIAQAKALIAYKRANEAQRPKSHAEQFKEWFNQMQGIEAQDEASAALAAIEEQARVEEGGYPIVLDRGVEASLPDRRAPREQFADWMTNQTAFNTFKS